MLIDTSLNTISYNILNYTEFPAEARFQILESQEGMRDPEIPIRDRPLGRWQLLELQALTS